MFHPILRDYVGNPKIVDVSFHIRHKLVLDNGHIPFFVISFPVEAWYLAKFEFDAQV
jgi:hypothetical protein